MQTNVNRKSKRGTLIGAAVLAGAVGVAPAARGQTFSAWSEPASLGPVLNTEATDGCPFIAKKGLSLYFASNRAGGLGGLDIYVSQRASLEEPWGPARNLGPVVNSPANELCPTLTIDGHRLFFVSSRPGCGGQDLHVAWRRNKRDDFAWESVENLGCTVNSPANDYTPSYVEDDETGEALLYFSSNRPGGPGGADIYVSSLGADGTFGPASRVEELTTPWDDERPNVRKDGREIFFDSNRPGTVGGPDLWTATRAGFDEPWSEPANLGPLVNSLALDGRTSLSFDGRALYFMSSRPGSTPGPTGSPSIDLYVTTRDKIGDPVE